MSYTISEVNGVKIYNLSAGKTLPQFLEEAKKKNASLKYNQDFRKRIELIQDFDFPVACNQVEITNDEQYIIATGVYAPTIKVYETKELSMKCLRGVDSEIVKFAILDDDYSKIAFAESDRNIEFHAQYGKHYKTRIPKFPRDITYNPFTCDLLISASCNEIYRISLEEGQFLKSFESAAQEINTLHFNKQLNFLTSGGNGGILEIWDYRQRAKATSRIVNNGQDITHVNFDSSGLVMGVGSEKGLVRLYDIRYDAPLIEIKHHYKMPINTIKFHEKTRNVLSSNERVIKVNNKDNGKVYTSIEPNSGINRFTIVPNSGLILVAQEEPRIGTYFLPQLDNAPKWCNFLENITEELEETQSTLVYDEFKFLSYEDLETLKATNLLGTPMLKPHLHGYLMHMKLYNKLKTKADVFNFQEYKQKEVAKKLEESNKSRLIAQPQKVKVNQEILDDLKEKSNKGKKDVDPFFTLVEDDRFKNMFTKDEFAVDKNNEAYIRAHPSEKGRKVRQKLQDMENEEIEAENKQLVSKEEDKAKKYELKQKRIQQKQLKNEKFEKIKLIRKEKKNKETFEKKIQKKQKRESEKSLPKFGGNRSFNKKFHKKK
ncbi:hypothetical protein ABPG74_011903 [Tetrahymena malaccensis]